MDDEFSDAGFDDLNDSVLQQLENNAIQFTQAQVLAQSQVAPKPQREDAFDYEFDDDDLDDTVVIDELAQPPPRPPPPQALPNQLPRYGDNTQRWNQHLPPSRPSFPPRPQYPPAQHRAPPQLVASQRYPPRPSQQYSLPSHHQPNQPPQPSQFARPAPPVHPHTALPQPRGPDGTANQDGIVAALRARLLLLESDLRAAKGEASVLRNRYNKAQATHEADVARLKKENAEQLAKHERIADQARTAERTTATELQFARQDLREELGRVKLRRKDAPATPRKDRKWGMGDGFDGAEILSSPTKSQIFKRKDSGSPAAPVSERTPTKGKRKRPAVSSPTFALEIDGGDAGVDGGHVSSAVRDPPPLVAKQHPFDFLRLLLDQTTTHGQPPTFELLSHYHFPSDRQHSLASMLLQKLPQMGNIGEPLSLLVEFADTVIEMWHRCLSERYHAPISDLISLLLHTLSLHAVEVVPHLIASLVPVCATTCRLVVLPRLNTADGNISDHPDVTVRQLCLSINVAQCLSLLYLAALACLPEPCRKAESAEFGISDPQGDFWRAMELDFILTMLSPKQPETDWMAMMTLLRTSVSPSSIGPAVSSATGSEAERRDPRIGSSTATLLDCVSTFLYQPPLWATSGLVKDIAARSAALGTLTAFATSQFGLLQIAMSDVAIPRLVTVLCWAVDRLYDADLPLTAKKVDDMDAPGLGDKMDIDNPETMAQKGSKAQDTAIDSPATADSNLDIVSDTSSLLARLVSQATWLLHLIVTSPETADVANTSAKLAASYGGSQRYFLTLARLNFAEEDLVLEAGIDVDTVELAHELLELAVTPDEGEEISEVFY
ncbi:hypothetical protein B0J18DRAFT_69662 [Chaetomium sp. MPI-SDFR-AT-0129]|nr:hypothetical protein B0J18DRAFT_69662 [Chaetomium sp. MPI-SDFR-AT-0129]